MELHGEERSRAVPDALVGELHLQQIADLLTQASDHLPAAGLFERPLLESLASDVLGDTIDTLSAFDDPMGMYAYCFCEPE